MHQEKFLQTDRQNRILSLDILRIIAILSVLMIHSSMSFVYYDKGSFEFVYGSIFDSISRVGVPLFVMISGALMLNENKVESNKTFVRNRIGKIIIIFIIWSVIYQTGHVILDIIDGEPISLLRVLYRLVKGEFHMWYLYMIVGLYLTTPILKKFVSVKNSKIVAYYICIAIIFTFTTPLLNFLSEAVPDLEYLLKITESFQMNFFSVFVTYYLTGWYVFNVGIKNKKIRYAIYLLSVICVMAVIGGVIATGKHSLLYLDSGILIYLYSLGIFTFICNLFKGKMHSNKFIKTLSNLSFGVYLIHILVLNVVVKILPEMKVHALYIPSKFFVVLILSYSICWVISKIPILKKIIKA